jgi:hypothetical protein
MNPIALHTHEDKLLEFAYGELPAPEARVMEAHVKGCQRCAGTLESIRGVRGMMSQLTPEPAPDAGLESLLAYAQQSARRTQAGPAPKAAWWRRFLVPVTGMAALATVVVVASQTMKQPEAELAGAPPAQAMKQEAQKVAGFPQMAQKDAVQMAPPAAPAAMAQAQQPTTGTRVQPESKRGFSIDVESRRDSVAQADYSNAAKLGAPEEEAPASAEVAAAEPAPDESEAERQEFLATAKAARTKTRKAEYTAQPVQVAAAPEPVAQERGALSMRAAPKTVGVARSESDEGLGYGLKGAAGGAAPAAAPDRVDLVTQANAAAESGDRAGEAHWLRKAVAANPPRAELERLLSRLCDAEVELGEDTTGCERLLREFPRSPAAQLAQRRLLAAPAGASKAAAPAKTKAAPLPAAPALKSPAY